jgi:hypothetical protein
MVTVGLLMAAMPFGTVVGAFVLSKMAAPSTRMRMMGWLASLSCVPLIGSAADPPLWCVLLLWTLAGGAVAQAIGAPLAAGLVGLIDLTAATMLAVSWTQLHGHLPPDQETEAAGS